MTYGVTNQTGLRDVINSRQILLRMNKISFRPVFVITRLLSSTFFFVINYFCEPHLDVLLFILVLKQF